MRYAAVRDLIHTGDLIAVRGRRGPMAVATRLITRSPYTHTAIAVWGGFSDARRLLVAESNAGGCSLAPLSQFEGTDFDVFACPVARDEAEQALWMLLGVDIAYGWLGVAAIAANRLLGVPLPPRDPDGLICSALSATIYLHAGWHPHDLPSIPAPIDVVDALRRPPLLTVRKD